MQLFLRVLCGLTSLPTHTVSCSDLFCSRGFNYHQEKGWFPNLYHQLNYGPSYPMALRQFKFILSPQFLPPLHPFISGNGIKIHSIAYTRNLGCHPWFLLPSPPTANPRPPSAGRPPSCSLYGLPTAVIFSLSPHCMLCIRKGDRVVQITLFVLVTCRRDENHWGQKASIILHYHSGPQGMDGPSHMSLCSTI